MDSARLTFLFYRYINQTCTDEERAEFMHLVNEADYDAQLKHLMNSLWESIPSEGRILPSATKERILAESLGARENRISKKKVSAFSRRSKAIAVFSIVLLCFCTWYFINVDDEAVRPAPLTSVQQQEHQIIKLPDGSIVRLNAGSTLEYPKSFAERKSREVFLTGEGYFDIRHDATKPFIVHTGNLTTTVLGTAFNIKAYPNEHNITVTVTRGKVKVSNEKKLIGIITPNQQITFDKNAEQAEQQMVDSNNTVAWSDNDIFFDDITLAEAMKQLEEKFQVTINIDNEKLNECRFTATFVRGEDLEQMLMVICEFNGSHFSRNAQGDIRIEGNGCGN